ncbi:hypothetical protein PISMIDRAFT_443883 [Pisolithus microcarpus 441]|uniref:Uncharacterized protein n=1 Tax=Pisolithus microcarpus 441 TaxID=765257 RepID=A0A0C9ZUZ7_9AGAM|nr:hypothetical protein PISMIDRAFT_443883 [Pisolithus microcarpus 441]
MTRSCHLYDSEPETLKLHTRFSNKRNLPSVTTTDKRQTFCIRRIFIVHRSGATFLLLATQCTTISFPKKNREASVTPARGAASCDCAGAGVDT